MSKRSFDNSCALVLGGHVNGYSIIKELSEEGIKNIALFDYGRSLAGYSNKIIYRKKIKKSAVSLLTELRKLNNYYSYIVVYPTDDLQIEHLHEIYDEVCNFCYLPFRKSSIAKISNKYFQYQICHKIGIPYPKSKSVHDVSHLDSIESLEFPLLIKPSTRADLKKKSFRALFVENLEEFHAVKSRLVEYVRLGNEFIVSEYIPGDDTNIYAYTCCRSKEGKILNEWSGKKLTQHPDNYGVVLQRIKRSFECSSTARTSTCRWSGCVWRN